MIIRDILIQDSFKKLKVLNGNADLNREIESVESTETPDVASFLPKHTLLLTTGMTYKNNQRGICDLIISLNELPCAGLAIKLGRFVNELHPDVIETADKLGFPLIQIPFDMTLGEVYHELLAFLWHDQNEELSFALNTQKKFSNLILQGASTKIMLNNLGFALGRPVAILTPFGEVLEANNACTKGNLNTAERLFEEHRLYETHPSVINHYEDENNGKNRISIYPIRIVGRNTYYLYIFDSEKLSSTMTTLIVDHVVLILGVSLYKGLYNYYNVIRNREDFLNILVNKYKSEKWSSHQKLTVGKKFGIKASSHYGVIIGTLENFEDKKFNHTNFSMVEERYILVYFWIDKFLKKAYKGSAILLPEPNSYRYVIILQGECKDIVDNLKKIHDIVLKMVQTEMIFSIGNNMGGVDSIVYSYNEAIESYTEGEVRNKLFFIKYYKPKSAKELLKIIPEDQVEKYCMHTLRELAYPEDGMLLELQKTLRVYLESNCSTTETANTMFLHRNTVKYRISKCEEILGNDFSKGNRAFEILMSLIMIEDRVQSLE